jgi:DNA (cytosine-5)-methyltransferase 1
MFSGAGGLSAGLRAAGFQVRGAIECVSRFAETHAKNFPESRTVTASAAELTPKEFRSRTDIKPGTIDLVAGGPPCQTFSTIGTPKIRHVTNRDVAEDPRNYLFKSFLDYVDYYEPRAFLMENVPQLRTKYGGRLFDRLIRMVDELNYEIHISVLNAADFGVPQLRRRLFIVGTQRGTSFAFPSPSHGPSAERHPDLFDEDAQRYRTVADALSDLPDIYDGCRLGDLPYRTAATSEFQRKMRSTTGVVGNNVCRVSNQRAKQVFAHMKQGDRYMDLAPEVRRILPFREDIFHDRLKRLSLEAPSWTVLAHIGMDGYMYIHPTEDRTLSVREAARLQSFHDDFEFIGNMREQYVQVGNAVPPLLAQAVGTSLSRALNP